MASTPAPEGGAPSLAPTPSPTYVYHTLSVHHGNHDEEPDYLIIFGSTIGGMMGMLCILLLYRHCLKRREYAYTRVYHGLDPEEEEFKRALESQTDEIDDLFDFSPDGEEGDLEDMEFDDKDLKQLEMLETYRRNLEGGLESEGTGREDEDVLDASV